MKKSVIAITLVFTLFAGLFVTMPVMAAPPGEQKVSVRIVWTPVSGSSSTLENRLTDGVGHRLITNKWTLQLYIGNAQTPLSGTADCTRHVLYAYTKQGRGVYQDDYVIAFASEGGGFEGRAHLEIFDWVSSSVYNVDAHALFQGTGAFEGQTLNVGVERGPANLEWTGYLLKPLT